MNLLFSLRTVARIFIFVLLSDNAYANCRYDIIEDTPNSDFIVHNDGTVTHTTTKLMWMRCPLGQAWGGATCVDSVSLMDWQSALSAAKNHRDLKYADWRLPNINELESIIERRCTEPAINEVIFPNTNSSFEYPYWTSTPHVTYTQYSLAYVVFFGSNFFDSGFIATNPTNNKLAVRLVRDASR